MAKWGVRYEEILGSDQYVKGLAQAAAGLDSANEQFLVIPPGGEISQIQFLR
jgi:hypothetical protein